MTPHRDCRIILAEARNQVGGKSRPSCLQRWHTASSDSLLRTRSPSVLPFLSGFQLPGRTSRVLNMRRRFTLDSRTLNRRR